MSPFSRLSGHIQKKYLLCPMLLPQQDIFFTLLSICPIFSSVRTYTKKIFVMSHVNVIIGHFYHLYVYMSHLTVSEGLFCYRFVYMSHASATAGHFFTLLSICPTFLIHWDIFRPLSFICPVWFFQQVFM